MNSLKIGIWIGCLIFFSTLVRIVSHDNAYMMSCRHRTKTQSRYHGRVFCCFGSILDFSIKILIRFQNLKLPTPFPISQTLFCEIDDLKVLRLEGQWLKTPWVTLESHDLWKRKTVLSTFVLCIVTIRLWCMCNCACAGAYNPYSL